MPLSALQGQLGSSRAAHLLRRATFGANRGDIATFSSLTASEAIQILFDENLTEPELPINPETGQGWLLGEPLGEETGLRDLNNQLIMWMIGLGADVTKPLNFSTREKLVFFWHTHFTTKSEKVANSRHLYHQIELFRQFAFDSYLPAELNFNSFLQKISIDNAMLRFLDGSQNVKGSPNENYARELMELYSIGRGLEGTYPTDLPQGDYVNYTEQDVQAAARVLSGLKIDNDFTIIDEDTQLPRGRVEPGAHDNDTKVFSHRFNNQEISPDPLLMGQAESARFICRKLYRFYVYHEIDEALQNEVIQSMADSLVANNYKIQPVIEELLQSEHFYEAALPSTDDDKFGAIIKSPLDLVLGTYRFFNLALADPLTEYDLFYSQVGSLRQLIDRMGMNYYEPFEVAGYPAYHQYPAFNRNWISSNYLTNRYDFINYTFNICQSLSFNSTKPTFEIDEINI